MIQKVKDYALMILAIFTTIFAALFYWERNKNAVDETLLSESKLNADLVAKDTKIADNNELLAQEEAKRTELEKSNKDTPDNLVDLLNRRKQ